MYRFFWGSVYLLSLYLVYRQEIPRRVIFSNFVGLEYCVFWDWTLPRFTRSF